MSCICFPGMTVHFQVRRGVVIYERMPEKPFHFLKGPLILQSRNANRVSKTFCDREYISVNRHVSCGKPMDLTDCDEFGRPEV